MMPKNLFNLLRATDILEFASGRKRVVTKDVRHGYVCFKRIGDDPNVNDKEVVLAYWDVAYKIVSWIRDGKVKATFDANEPPLRYYTWQKQARIEEMLKLARGII